MPLSRPEKIPFLRELRHGIIAMAASLSGTHGNEGGYMKLEDVFAAADRGQLMEFMDAHAAEFTPELGEQARTTAKAALSAGNVAAAEGAFGAAANIYLTLAEYHQAVKNMIDLQQVRYMVAELPEQYAQVRGQLLDSVAKAKQVGALDEAFKAARIAADCSYWAAMASSAEQDIQALTLQTLTDVISATAFLGAGLTIKALRGDGEIFVSLAAAAAGKAMSIAFWPEERAVQADGLLRQLARIMDAIVPVDFTYGQAGDRAKARETAQVLARLSDSYGE
jgi:hypothetical protein